MTGQVAFVDCETLGLDADLQPVWELAWITPEQERCVTIPRTPRELALAHPVALEMMSDRYQEAMRTRFDEIPRAHVLTEQQAISLFASEVRGLHLVGAVVSFDEERLRRMAWRHGVEATWHYHLIDVEALAVGFLAGQADQHNLRAPLTPPWKSDDLSRLVGVEPDDFAPKHSALADARWAKAIYETVMGE